MESLKFEQIWYGGIIILDTCTLDYISRCEFEYAKSIMDILLFCKNRVFIPKHVSEEMMPYFERNIIHKDVSEHMKDLEREISEICSKELKENVKKGKIIGRIQKKIDLLKKYSFGLYASELEKIKKGYGSNGEGVLDLKECIARAEQKIDFVNKDDTVKSFLKMILENTFDGFTEDEKIQIDVEYEDRLRRGLPPGGGDKGKRTNTSGDFIIWKEILKNIKLSGKLNYLFITEDKKRKNNWYDESGKYIHPLLRQEVINLAKYDAVDVMDLYRFIRSCQPFVNEDIDKICEYLINHNQLLQREMEKHFEQDEQGKFIEEISDVIRNEYDGDWAIPYTYDVNIMDLGYEVSEFNCIVKVLFDFQIEGFIDTCYHFGGEDNMFDAEFYINGSATVAIPIKSGSYSNSLMLDYLNMDIDIGDIYVETSDPLERDKDEDYGEDYDENYDEDYDEDYYLDGIDDF